MTKVATFTTEQKLQHIYDRIGWVHMRTLLGGMLKTTAQGVSQFAEKVNELVIKDPNTLKTIDEFYSETITGGNLYCKLYKLSDTDTEKLRLELSKENISINAFSESYPYPVSYFELNSIHTGTYLVDKREPKDSDEAYKFIYASKNYITVSKEISSEALKASSQYTPLTENGGKITIKSRVPVQVFNSIVICKKHNLVILCVDCSQVPVSESSTAFVELEKIIKAKLGRILLEPINLYSKIESLYQDIDGYVQAISFVTGDGNTSQLKLKKGMTCVKTDSYHIAGSKEVGDLIKFEIDKQWTMGTPFEKTYPLSLQLNGKRTMVEDTNEKLPYVLFEKCPSSNDFRFLIDKIINSEMTN